MRSIQGFGFIILKVESVVKRFISVSVRTRVHIFVNKVSIIFYENSNEVIILYWDITLLSLMESKGPINHVKNTNVTINVEKKYL